MPFTGIQNLLRGFGILLLVTVPLCAFGQTPPPWTKPIPVVIIRASDTLKKIDPMDPDGIATGTLKKTKALKARANQVNSSGNRYADAEDALSSINRAQETVHKTSSTCVICDLSALTGADLEIKRPTSRSMAPRCSALVDSKGKLGEGGKSLVTIMSEPKYVKYYTQSNALGSYCPKFNELSQTQKLQAWTWFWTSLAQEESSCRVDIKHGTSYNKDGKNIILNPREGYGLWALEYDPNIRRSRGEACRHIKDIDGQARCSIDIMVKTQLSHGAPASGKIGYWGPVRREYKDHQLMPHMRRFSLCF